MTMGYGGNCDPIEPEPDDDECFAYDLFLACVTGFIARDKPSEYSIYQEAKAMAQSIYDQAANDRNFNEVMDQTWPTKDS